ncbi:MAG: DNA repair and recombination protein RadB [Thermoplasmataceae archaeon]
MERVQIEKGAKLAAGVSCVDDLMEGGLEPGIITEIYGEGGAGKTNLCMIFSLAALIAGQHVIFLDSEGFSSERFLQVTRNSPELIENFALYRVVSLDDQEVSLMRASRLMEKRRPGLIVIDSFTEHFRLEKSGDSSRVPLIQKQLSLLQGMAIKFNVPVLMTNQIYMDIETGNLTPFGGFIIDHIMKAIYRIEKAPGGKRVITVEKHRSIREGKKTELFITGEGIACARQQSP